MANPPKISVIYYSATGNVARLAHEIARGAESIGAEIRLRHAEETAPAEAIARNPGWQEFADQPGDPLAQLEDLVWADGIALGSPTRFGGPASQLT
jgi:NAD(P)H dehydrogenase (quinone)